MTKRKKRKSKKIQQHIETIGGLQVEEETIPKEERIYENKPTKILDRVSSEKIVAAPQTYIEDVFDLENQETEEKVIENEIKKKEKKFITEEELYKSYIFQNKLTKIRSRVEFEKGFDFLLDFVNATKLYRTFYVNDELDEFDFLLKETALHFTKRLARIQLSYKVYQEIIEYFDNLKNLYGQYKHTELVSVKSLNDKLENMKDKSEFIKYYIF